jgi:UDP-N-acetylmuramoyl-L-alanyl-D-glutamate--2,6-diaminopimelate ligase
MNLRELAGPNNPDVEITSLAYDSRQVQPGALFFCIPGLQVDGHLYAKDAVARGVSALVVERGLSLGVPEVVVDDARQAMGSLAANFYRWPSAELKLVGVTGTNGKTTTTHFIRSLLEASNIQCGLLGTVGAVIGGEQREVQRTTPEAIDLQRDLRAMVDGGDRVCAMEVSSHALTLHRTDSLQFAVAVFTNLTQDHLDFHPTMEEYFQAKRLLFDQNPGAAVINVDDEYGRRLAANYPQALTFAIERDAHFCARELSESFSGSRFVLHAPNYSAPVNLPLPGRFNVANLLGAIAALSALGMDLDKVVNAISQLGQVPGRFESVVEGQDFAVLVDYAHTPDALVNVLAGARALTSGRVICVFGCGGDRDRAKRPLMGQVVANRADEVVVTSDNPRSEDPERIIDEVVVGIDGSYQRQSDRREAIERAISGARSGDVVVIAGKGHEQGQEFANGRKLPFDDATVAREVLQRLVGANQ